MPKCNDAGIALIQRFEGQRLRAYPDPGSGGDPWTIGFGHTANVHPGEVITVAQALAFLKLDIAGAETVVALNTHTTLTPNQFSALVSFQYNTGLFRNSLVAQFVNARQFQTAMVHLERYVYASGAVLPGLVTRRLAERSLFLAPEPAEGAVKIA